jgi:hypothetical protein
MGEDVRPHNIMIIAVVAPAAVVTHACMHAVDMHMCILGNLTGVVVAAEIKKMQ